MNKPFWLTCTIFALACVRPTARAPQSSTEIVETLSAADGALSLRIKSQAQEWKSTQLPPTADGEWRVGIGKVPPLALVHEKARDAKLELEGKRAIYRKLYPSTDAVLVNGASFVEEFFVLRDEKAPSAFSWSVRLLSGLKSIRADGRGGLEFVDSRGKRQLRMPRPFAIDSRGTRREASLQWDRDRIAMKIDTAGLSYPILVDPVIEQTMWIERFSPGSIGAAATLGSKVVASALSGNVEAANETWEFDGSTWSQLAPSVSPGRREFAGMATRGNHVVLFGGEYSEVDTSNDTHNNTQIYDETWEWDGTNWELKSPATKPAPRRSPIMVSSGSNVLLYGGLDSSDNRLTDTWEWDGANWSKKAPTVSPPSIYGPEYSAAAQGGNVVLFNSVSAQTWLWDGTDWTLSKATGPTLGAQCAMGSLGDKAILVGVENGSQSDMNTWIWDGTAWTEVAIGQGPPWRFSIGMAFTLGNQLYVRGGGNGELDDLWAFDGTSWTQVAANSTPPGLDGCAMALSPGGPILFGGFFETMKSDTYSWNGTWWRALTPATQPKARKKHAMAALGINVVMFGGTDASNNLLSDTWEWDGTNWNQETPATSPSARSDHAMASLNGKVVLFGGRDATGDLGDTWEWDGATWNQLFPATSPSPRSTHAMATFGSSILLFGGDGNTETWEWDGTNWMHLTPATQPFGGNTPYMASLGASVLLFLNSASVGFGNAWAWDGSDWTSLGALEGETGEGMNQGICMGAENGGAILHGLIYNDTWEYITTSVQGSECTDSSQCLSLQCVDGYCCDKECPGQCQACNVAGKEGTCTPITGTPPTGKIVCANDGSLCAGTCDSSSGNCSYPDTATTCRPSSCAADVATLAALCDGAGNCPAIKTQMCSPYHCQADACAGNCAVDSDCEAGSYCSAGICVPQVKNGTQCYKAAECSSGNCADGYCCDQACAGQCQACNVSQHEGACTLVIGAPVNPRPACTGDGSVCSGSCDGKRGDICATIPSTSVSCRPARCLNGTATLAANCDGAGRCETLQTQACAPYVCAANTCATACQADSDCEPGKYCFNAVCGKGFGAGKGCADFSDCASGYCADGVCCDAACTGQCEACDQPGHEGACRPVLGAPVVPRTACVTDGSLCGGHCDGVHGGACAFADSSTICLGASCAYGSASSARVCDGKGMCASATVENCAPFACAGSACASSCVSNSDCGVGDYCSNGVCIFGIAQSEACVSKDDCVTGYCVDGVCCDRACDGQCEACDVPNSVGKCAQRNGAPEGNRLPCPSGEICQAGSCAKPSEPLAAGGCSCGSATSLPMLEAVWLAFGALFLRRRRSR